MKIIDRLPIPEEGWKVPIPDGAEEVRPYQIIVRVSITAENVQDCPPETPTIPAILDTGNNHNFAIRQEHWDRWIHWAPRRIGQINVSGFIVPLFEAKVWIHSNREGTVELSGGISLALRMDRGDRHLSINRDESRPPPDPGPARPHPQRPQAHDRRRNPGADPRISPSLTGSAIPHPPTNVTFRSQMRMLDKPAMDRRLRVWD